MAKSVTPNGITVFFDNVAWVIDRNCDVLPIEYDL